MAKTCSKCGASNKNSADFCENCGELFPETSGGFPDTSTGIETGQSHILGKLIPLIVVLGFFGFFMFSGIFDDEETALDETFQANGLSFDYPEDWQIVESPADIVSGGSELQDLGTLTGSGVTLTISSADLSEGWLVDEAKEVTLSSIQESDSVEVSSETTKTVNGLTVYEIRGTVQDSATSQEDRFLYVITGKDKIVVYYLQFIAEASSFDHNEDLINSIVDTINIQ